MKYFELSSFRTNKLVHLLSDFWIYQKYPSPFDVQDSYLNRGGWREGWRFICVHVCVYLSAIQQAPTLFTCFWILYSQTKFQTPEAIKNMKKFKKFNKIAHFFPCDQCHQSGVSCLCTPVHPERGWAWQSVLRRSPLSSDCPEVGSSLKRFAVFKSVENSITRIGMTMKNRSLFPIL